MAINVPDLLPVKNIYDAAGFALRFVGGCVRDTLLGLIPSDYDLATPMPVHQGIALLKEHGYTVIPTGVDHGTFTLVINKRPYEITTLRRDIATDGRRATISYTDKWEEDAARRDFTINALYMDFDGTVYDYTQGQQDLQNGVVRFIGNASDRIQEDYLRILRFFRFHERFSTQAVPGNLKEIFKTFAPQITTLSAERITHEFFLLLGSNAPYDELVVMDECHILSQFLETYNLDKLRNLCQIEIDLSVRRDPLRRFSSLEVGSHGLRLSNKEKQYLKTINHLYHQIDHESIHYLAYKYGLKEVLDTFLLKNDRENWAKFSTLMIPQFPLNGHDLADIGIIQGPGIGKAITIAERTWGESKYTLSKQQLLDHLSQVIISL